MLDHEFPSAYLPQDPYAAFDCRVNALDVAELFERYEEGGFIYPAKRIAMAPHQDRIEANWRAATSAGHDLLRVITHEAPDNDGWGTVCVWRHAHGSWMTQHLVAHASPSSAARVMMAGLVAHSTHEGETASQLWHQARKRMPQRIFGSMVEAIGPDHASTCALQVISLPLDRIAHPPASVSICPVGNQHRDELQRLATEARGHAYATAEELDHEDLLLEQVDALYRRVGLRRHRRIWLAYLSGEDRAGAAVIAYRGPLGLNFSFLESRIDLLVRQDLPEEARHDAVHGLIRACAALYEDFPLQRLIVACSPNEARSLIRLGGRSIQHYTQTICLAEGYPAWYRHVATTYQRVLRLRERRVQRQHGSEDARIAAVS